MIYDMWSILSAVQWQQEFNQTFQSSSSIYCHLVKNFLRGVSVINIAQLEIHEEQI